MNRILALGAAVLLSGCAALQVDVDVYKGPLGNSQETQSQQLASMALSAKPLIEDFRNRLIERLQAGTEPHARFQLGAATVYIPQKTLETFFQSTAKSADESRGLASTPDRGQGAVRPSVPAPESEEKRLVRHLNGMLALYLDLCAPGFVVPEPSSRTGIGCAPRSDAVGDTSASGRGPRGIESLASALAALGPSPESRGFEDAMKRQQWVLAVRELESALVDFAGRLQFFANNQWLVYDSGTGEGDTARRLKTLLEAISNSLMLHADEQRRFRGHHDRDRRMGGAEAMAAKQVLRPTADALFNEFRGRIEGKLNERVRAQAASRSASAPRAGALPGAGQLGALTSGAETRRQGAGRALATAILLSPTLGDAQTRGEIEKLAQLGFEVREGFAPLHSSLRAAAPAGTATVATFSAAVLKWATAKVQADADLDASIRSLQPGYFIADAATHELKELAVPDAGSVATREAAFAVLRGALIQRAAEAAAAAQRLGDLARQAEAAANRTDVGDSPSALLPAQVTEALTLLRALRERVVTEVVARSDWSNPAVMRGVLQDILRQQRAELERAGKATTDIDNLQLALGAIPLPPPPRDLPHTLTGSMEVLDAYIAELRYKHLAAVERSGEDSPEASNLAAAIVLARKQRADMVFIRPSSAYLRSSLSSTATQDESHVRWRNMLNDTLQNLFSSMGPSSTMDKTREDLDKAFWQNINRVRLNGGGFTNYVVAKDDVGNWYVKGMGADLSPMVNAAKNLALYNLGGRLNTNLLRIDELRGRLDNDSSASEAQRADWKDELERLGGPQSGPVVADRGDMLKQYRKRYDDLLAKHVKDLAAALETEDYKRQIQARWSVTVTGTGLAALTGTMALPAPAKAWADAQQVLKQDFQSTRDRSEAVIASLAALERFRVAVRAAVLVEPSLVKSASDASEAAAKTLADQDRSLAAAYERIQALSSSVAAKAADVKRFREVGRPAEDIKKAQDELDALLAEHAKEAKAYDEAAKTQATSRAALATAQQGLTAAQAVRQKLAEDASVVMSGIVRTWVNRRLRSAEELETAATVVGRK